MIVMPNGRFCLPLKRTSWLQWTRRAPTVRALHARCTAPRKVSDAREPHVSELHAAIAADEIDTVIVAFADAQGRLVGKRVSARLFQEEVLPHGAEACNYLLVGRRRHEHRRRLRDVELGERLRRHDAAVRPRHPAAHPVAAGHGARDGRPRVGGRRPGRAVAARDPQAPARAPRRARPDGLRRAPSSSSSSSTTPTAMPGPRAIATSRPSTDYNVDYDLLASGRLEPLLRDIRLGMDGAGMYCEGVKGECNFGQQEIAFRYAEVARDRRQAHDLQERREGDRRAARQVAHLHGEVQRARGQQLPHPPVGARRRTERRSWRATASTDSVRFMEHWIAGILATLREFTLLYAPNDQLVQALREGQLRAHGRRVGTRQPHLRAARGRPRPVAARREPRARRRRQPVPRHRGDHRRRPARHRERAAMPDPLAGNAYASDVDQLPTTLREAAQLFERVRRSRARPSATRWSSTTSTRRGSRSRPTTPP